MNAVIENALVMAWEGIGGMFVFFRQHVGCCYSMKDHVKSLNTALAAGIFSTMPAANDVKLIDTAYCSFG